MTNKEAIEILKTWRIEGDRNHEAFDMAIKALECEPSEDMVKDLSKRLDTLEKQMKEDREEKLKELQAELDYARFRCGLPTIMNMMSHN